LLQKEISQKDNFSSFLSKQYPNAEVLLKMLVLQNETDNHIFDEKIEEIIDFLLERFDKNSEIAVALVSSDEIQQFNFEYRGKDKPTNVLSFPSGVPAEIADILGDIVICLEVVEKEARQQNKAFEHHLTHILIHGFLHLLGYDHIKDDEAETMENLEIEILQELQINNPYI
jgi:probable rRNA maturation factor